jgi:hypothetical protein
MAYKKYTSKEIDELLGLQVVKQELFVNQIIELVTPSQRLLPLLLGSLQWVIDFFD